MLKNDAQFFQMIYDFFVHATGLTYAAISVGVFMAILYFRIIFEDWEGFKEALNEGYNGWGMNGGGMSPRLMIWLMISIGCGCLAYCQLPGWFPHLFGRQ